MVNFFFDHPIYGSGHGILATESDYGNGDGATIIYGSGHGKIATESSEGMAMVLPQNATAVMAKKVK